MHDLYLNFVFSKFVSSFQVARSIFHTKCDKVSEIQVGSDQFMISCFKSQ